MGGVDGAFDEAISSIESALKKMRKAWDDIVDHVNWGLKFLPDGVADQVRKSTQKLGGEYHKADGWILDTLLERGSPGALRAAVEQWNSKVLQAVSDNVRELAFAAMPSNGRWKGDAQVAYRSVVDNQNKALDDLKRILGELSSTLNAIADSIKEYWIAMAVAYLGLCGAMVICALWTVGLVTIPTAITTAIGAAALFWGAVTTASIMFTNSLDSNKAKLEGLTTQNSTDGTWPPPTAEFSDGSVLDDDEKSDWEPIL
jgi:uncharacterized protein YukE